MNTIFPGGVVSLPSAEGVLRAFVRAITFPEPVAYVNFGVPAPKPNAAVPLPFPMVIIRRIGGARDTMVALDYPLVQFDVWHSGVRGEGGKLECEAITNRLVDTINQVGEWSVELSPGQVARLAGGNVQSVLWRPDEVAHRTRYIVTASFTLTVGSTS